LLIIFIFDTLETTSESGISELDMSEKCNCCPYGYHIDVDFVTYLQTLGGKDLNKQLKKIQRKRNEHLQRSMEYVIDEVVSVNLICLREFCENLIFLNAIKGENTKCSIASR
jgi:hypothetical protein